jgi:hypothetical protein
MKLWVKICILSMLARTATAQTSVEAVVDAVFKNHPLLQAASFSTQAKKYAEKSALNLPNPEVNIESPTGEFYAVGILQSFDFPTVYARKKQVAQAETTLAQVGQKVNENDLRYAARQLYLTAQVSEYQAKQWTTRDSLYQLVVATAARQFSAGEINFLHKTLVENEAAKVHQERLIAERNAEATRKQLIGFSGLNDLGVLIPLVADTLGLKLITALVSNPNIAYEQQAVRVAEQQLSLVKSQALPNFSLGYLNQGARSTPLNYRFRASVGIPLWTGQYQGARQRADSEAKAAQSRVAAQSQSISLGFANISSEAMSALGKIRYYEQEALQRSRLLITTAIRLREAGEVNYVDFLRTLDEAFSIPREYAQQLQTFESARIKMLYYTGN